MSTVALDLSKLTPQQITLLQSLGAIPAQPAPATPTLPTPTPPAPAAQPILVDDTSGETAAAVVQPPSVADKIAAAASEISQVLATGVAGQEVGAIGQAASLAAGVGDVIWHMFNKHTGTTTYHKSLSDAITSGAAHMQQQQPDVVANADPNTAFEITPVVHISGADVAKMPKQAGSGTTQT